MNAISGIRAVGIGASAAVGATVAAGYAAGRHDQGQLGWGLVLPVLSLGVEAVAGVASLACGVAAATTHRTGFAVASAGLGASAIAGAAAQLPIGTGGSISMRSYAAGIDSRRR